MQLYLSKKNATFDIIQPLIGWAGFVSQIELKQKLGAAASSQITLNREDKELLSSIVNNDDIAFRLIDSESDIDIPFVKKEDGQTDTETGAKLELISFVDLIKNKKPYFSTNQLISEDAYQVITKLDTQVAWGGIGQPQTIEYNSGSKNNLEILNEICKRNGWSYREDGYGFVYVNDYASQTAVLTSLPRVLVGDFKTLPVTRIITNYSSYSDDTIILNEIKRKSKVTSFKFNKIIGTLAGSGSNTPIQINSSVSTDTFYPVQKRLNGQSVGEFYIVDLEQTVDDYNTITIQLWNGATSQDLYNLALIEIVKRKNQYLYEVEIVTKKFIKAGEKVRIEYSSETLPLFFEATVVESNYDFGTGFSRLSISAEPTMGIENKNIIQIKKGLEIIREQQSTPQ